MADPDANTDLSIWTFPITPFVGYGWGPTNTVTFTSSAGAGNVIPDINSGGAKGPFVGTAYSAINKNAATGLQYGIEIAGGAGINFQKTQSTRLKVIDDFIVTMHQAVKGWYSVNGVLGTALTNNLNVLGKIGGLGAHIVDKATILDSDEEFAFSTNKQNRLGYRLAAELEYSTENAQICLGCELLNYGHVDLNLISTEDSTWSAQSTTINDRIKSVRLGYRFVF